MIKSFAGGPEVNRGVCHRVVFVGKFADEVNVFFYFLALMLHFLDVVCTSLVL